MKYNRIFLILLVAASLTGCSTIQVQSDYDESVDFGAYSTYAYMEAPQGVLAGNAMLATSIEQAVDSELATDGYRKIESGTPDFYVAYHGAVNEVISSVTVERWGYGWRRWARTAEVRVDTYQQGTLVIDIVNAADKELVWRGSVQGNVDNPERARKNIGKAIAKILEEFPPQSNP